MVHTSRRLGDYRVLRELSATGRSLLVEDAHGHRLVLKLLPHDCLMGDQLHPNIRQRLARVRELADLRVAALRGVERIDGRAYLVWEYIEGEPLADRLGDPPPALLREVALAVESLHSHGLVHGAVHARNVILTHGVGDSNRAVRLTHVSPLLYDEPRDDAIATIEMFESLLPAGTWNQSLRQLLRDARSQRQPLSWLRGRLRLSASPTDFSATDKVSNDQNRRRNLRLLASVILLGALVFSILITFWSVRSSPNRSSPPLRAGDLVSPAPSSVR